MSRITHQIHELEPDRTPSDRPRRARARASMRRQLPNRSTRAVVASTGPAYVILILLLLIGGFAYR